VFTYHPCSLIILVHLSSSFCSLNAETGIKYYDLRVGGGDAVVKGNLVTVRSLL